MAKKSSSALPYEKWTEERKTIQGMMALDPRHALHATVAGYRYYKCRCGKCRKFKREEDARNRAIAKTKPTPEAAHGTRSGYTYWGCKCKACTQAHTDYTRQNYRKRHGLE